MERTTLGLTRTLSLVHGLYYLVTGVWPLVWIDGFQWLTGPKKDLWLVKTAGVLIGMIGSVLIVAGIRGKAEPEIDLLAVGSALSLATIDIVYVRRRRILPIYLLDAAVEIALATGWVAARFRRVSA